MKTSWITNGTRSVAITRDCGRVSARLYVNRKETATLTNWNGKTLKGAIRWAMRTLGMREA